MPLTAPPPPDEVAEALHRNLQRLARAPGSPVPSSQVAIARGLALRTPVTILPKADLEVGWRFVVTHGKTVFWVDMLGGEEVSIFQGPAVADMLRAGSILEASGLDGEVCVLTSPLIAGGALWVRGLESCVQFSPKPNDAVQKRGILVEEWLSRVAGLAGQTAGLIE